MSDQYQIQDVPSNSNQQMSTNDVFNHTFDGSVGGMGIDIGDISMMMMDNPPEISGSSIPIPLSITAPNPMLTPIPNASTSASASASGAAGGAGSGSGPWYPPVPSLASLPVDKSKTDPKPAYYKLQFGDEVTGFSYYVRTLAVMIGRNCDRNGAALPPPSITAPSVPINPPLDPNQPSPPLSFSQPMISPFELPPDEVFNHISPPPPEQPIVEFPTPPIHQHTSFSVPPQSPPHPSSAPLSTHFLNDGFSVPPRAQSEGMIDYSLPPDLSFFEDEVYPEIDMGEFGVLEELAEAVKTEQNLIKQASLSVEPESVASHSQSQTQVQPSNADEISVKIEEVEKPLPSQAKDHNVPSTESEQVPAVDESSSMQVDSAPAVENGFYYNDGDMDMSHIKFEDIEEIPLPPPPPPPAKSSGPTEHVDVDLGPLKSVSRNHAKIEYRTDLGHFCLEIYGRNGAWVDDRYFVKGSVVPLAQGSQIQIATRIFSFVLPPSPISSPTYTHYALDGVAADAMEDLPYPYNLPPSEVGYQEFYGEPGPGPSSAASMAARAPPAFNAFAAEDGYGLGIEGVGENKWVGWNSDDDDDDDDDDSEEELDESGEEWEEGEEISLSQSQSQSLNQTQTSEIVSKKDKDKSKSKTSSKSKSKASKSGLVPGEDDSDLSSVASEPEEEKKKKVKKQSSNHVTKNKPIAPAPAPPTVDSVPTTASIVNPETTSAIDSTAIAGPTSTSKEAAPAVDGTEAKSASPKKSAKKKDKSKEKKDKDEDKVAEADDKPKEKAEEKNKEKSKNKKEKSKEADKEMEGEKGTDKQKDKEAEKEKKQKDGAEKQIDDGQTADEIKKKKKKKKPKPDETTPKVEETEVPPVTTTEGKDGAPATPAKKSKKVKTGESATTVDGEEDVKPTLPEKKKKKKKPKVDGEIKASDPTTDPVKSSQSTAAAPPIPSGPLTLAEVLPSAPQPPGPIIPPKAPAPAPTPAAVMGPTGPTPTPPSAPPIAAQQPVVRPPGPVASSAPGQATQPVHPGQQPVQSIPGQPIPPRPPMQGFRPPPHPQTPQNMGQHPNAQYVRPPHPGQPPYPHSNLPHGQGQYPHQYTHGPGQQPHPSQMVRPPPPGYPIQPQGQLTPPSAPPSPIPMAPFYCTELIETEGQPGHIIVNVPIPPSGAGPRPPPGPLLGLDGQPFIGPPPLKPTQTFATIIHRSLQCLPRGRGTLGEVCNWVAGEWEWFRLNVDSGWQNSIRHNLSLNKAFLKVSRIPEDDPESKGSVWIIDPEEGPLFEEKQKRDAMKSASKDKNAESRREKERIRAEERAKKQREAAIEAARNPQPQMIQRTIPVVPRPIPRPIPNTSQQPTAPPQPPAPVSANAKGVLQPKAKIVVVMQPITPAMRTKSVISTTDANGNPLPFVCDGTTLVLDQSTFGHLTTDILDKLTLLGAAGAVDVLSAWVINKNKQQATKAAQAKTGTGAAASNVVKNGTTVNNGVSRPGTANTTPGTTGGVVRPAQTVNKPAVGATQPVKPNVGAAKPNVNNSGKPLPGPAPPGTTLTKVIGMIAAVANAKGDVNTVGPNASALLRYIRVVGVDIDLRVAERIWATGVVPPLPQKKGVVAKPNTAGAGTSNGVAKAGTAAATSTAGSSGTPKPAASTTAAKPTTAAATTGVIPNGGTTVKPVTAASTTTSTVTSNTAKPATAILNAGTTTPKPASASNPSSAPSIPATSAPVTVNTTAASPAPAPVAATGMKRKLEDDAPRSTPTSVPSNNVGASATNPIIVGGGSGGGGGGGAGTIEQEAKKPRLETSGA